MARTFNGTSDYLDAPVDLSTTTKLTLVFWLNLSSFLNTDGLAFEFTPNTNSSNGFYVDPNASDGNFQIGSRGDIGYCTADFTRPSTGWHHYAILIDRTKSTNEVDSIYVDGVSQILTYTSNVDNSAAFGNSTFYFMSRAGSSLFTAGSLAAVAIYPGTLLTGTQISSLASGTLPGTYNSVTPYYWRLAGTTSPEPEANYGANAVVNGTTQGADPPQLASTSVVVPWNLFWGDNMPIKNQSVVINYVAWDTSANTGKTGDVANHALRIVGDGTSAASTNSPSEVDSVNCPGVYKITLTAAEMNFNSVAVVGKSSTSNVSIMPVLMTTQDASFILNASQASYVTAGSVGESISLAATPEDPIDATIASYTTPGTVGYLLKTNLDTNVGSRLASLNLGG